MKTIAVLVPTFTIEYSLDVLSGISDYFKDKDVQVIITQTKIHHLNQGAYDFQYCTSFEYLKAKDVDAYIVTSGVYCSSMPQNDFTELIAAFGERPVISIGTRLKLKNSYTIVADCNKSYKQIINHLKENHGCSKIAFFSANSTKSEEALQRYDAFTSALSANKLPFYPNMVYDGFFTDFRAYEEMKKRFITKSDIPFDAIVCANDMMALGCLKALNEIGGNVPDDVKIIGFDDSLMSRLSSPRISSINQDVYSQGYEAAEIAYRLLNGEKQNKSIKTPLLPKYRQSCGCVDCFNNQHVYKNGEGDNINEINSDPKGTYSFADELNEKNNIITLMDTVKGANTLKQLYYNLRYICEQCNFPSIIVSLFKDVVFVDSQDEFVLPSDVELALLYDKKTNVELFKPEVYFNPHEKVLPSRTIEESNGIFLFSPIFLGQKYYGYLLCKVEGKRFADYTVYLKILITAIAQTYENTSRIQENQRLENETQDLKRQSRTDELTGILNRRGFIDKGQKTLDMLQETDKAGVIFFLDIDGLKKINDTYGHDMSEKAIIAQAKSLKSVFRTTDVIGRLGGDQFGIVAVGTKIVHLENIKLKIEMMNKKISKEDKLPFELSFSLGAVDLQGSSVLINLLSEADKELAKEKRKKHATIS